MLGFEGSWAYVMAPHEFPSMLIVVLSTINIFDSVVYTIPPNKSLFQLSRHQRGLSLRTVNIATKGIVDDGVN